MPEVLTFKGEIDLQNDDCGFDGVVDIDQFRIDEENQRIMIHFSGASDFSGAFTAQAVAQRNAQNTYVTTFELKHGGIITNKFEKIVFTIDAYTLNAQKTECAIKGSWAQPVAGEPKDVVWRFDDLLEC